MFDQVETTVVELQNPINTTQANCIIFIITTPSDTPCIIRQDNWIIFGPEKDGFACRLLSKTNDINNMNILSVLLPLPLYGKRKIKLPTGATITFTERL
jgi:tRNA(Leu) C34 or U34 (ribose-2'-O)-methylase TrmL